MFPQAHYKGMYNCAGNDVYCTGGVDGPDYDCEGFNVPPENQTHIFWAMAYITPCARSVQPQQSPHARTQ